MSMLQILVLVVISVLFLIPFWILILKLLPNWLNIKRGKLELDQDNFYYSIDMNAKKDLLDEIINEELQRYQILELGYKNPEDIYLNEDDQKALIKKISARVYSKRMTPAILSTLSYYYVFENETQLMQIILDHTALA